MADFWHLQRFDTLPSTSDLCKDLAAAGAPQGTAVTALEQTAGRGRQGRSFFSPKGAGLYLSVLLRPQTAPETAAQLTAWTAVALQAALLQTCQLHTDIKWPNDLQLGGKKLCGILTEFVPPDGVVIGMGVNLTQTARDLGDLSPIATSLLLETGSAPDFEELLAEILARLETMSRRFPHEKEAVLQAYRQSCVTLNRPVTLLRPHGATPAFALDIDDNFGLRVAYENGTTETIQSGEVSVRTG
ncbi:MAG: biotin--[acetyl-CoA-carboxylase] ligase [Oscillospiraceae bacterium]